MANKFKLTLSEPENIPIDFSYDSGEEQTLWVRPFNVIDWSWYSNKFEESDLIKTINEDQDMTQTFEVFVHQLDDSDRATLAQALNTDEDELVDTLLNIIPVDPSDNYNASQDIMSVVFLSMNRKVREKEASHAKKIQRHQRRMKWLRWWLIGMALLLMLYYAIPLIDSSLFTTRPS